VNGSQSPMREPSRHGVLRRALRGRGWWFAIQWAVISAALTCAAYLQIKPVYESATCFRIEPLKRLIEGPRVEDAANFAMHLETQAQVIASPNVLSAALQNPKVATSARYAKNIDAPSELRKDLRVEVIPGTHLIRISVATESPVESANVANAVLDAYLKTSEGWTFEETMFEAKRLKELKQEYTKKVEDLRNEIRVLVVRMAGPDDVRSSNGPAMSKERRERLLAQLDGALVARTMAEARIEALRARILRKPSAATRREDQIEDLEIEVEANRTLEKAIKTQLPVDPPSEPATSLAIEYARIDLQQAQGLLDIVNKQLNELEYETRRVSQMSIVYRAERSPKPARDGRWVAMAVSPLISFCGLLSVFLISQLVFELSRPSSLKPSASEHDTRSTTP
jgi:hypothetical protein